MEKLQNGWLRTGRQGKMFGLENKHGQRQPETYTKRQATACPACWAMGTKEFK
jgi:hypothetical protein